MNKKCNPLVRLIDEMEKMCNENREVKKSLTVYLKGLTNDKEWKKAMRLLLRVRRSKSKKGEKKGEKK